MRLNPFACKHKWHIIDSFSTESELEHFQRISNFSPSPKNTQGSEQLCKKKYVRIVSCGKCGKLKKIVVKSH